MALPAFLAEPPYGSALALGLMSIPPFTRMAMVLEQIVPGETWLDNQRITATAFSVGMLLALAALALEVRLRARLAQSASILVASP